MSVDYNNVKVIMQEILEKLDKSLSDINTMKLSMNNALIIDEKTLGDDYLNKHIKELESEYNYIKMTIIPYIDSKI